MTENTFTLRGSTSKTTDYSIVKELSYVFFIIFTFQYSFVLAKTAATPPTDKEAALIESKAVIQSSPLLVSTTPLIYVLPPNEDSVVVGQPILGAGNIEKIGFNVPSDAIVGEMNRIIQFTGKGGPGIFDVTTIEPLGGSVDIVPAVTIREFTKPITFTFTVNSTVLTTLLRGRDPSIVKAAYFNGASWIVIPNSKLKGNSVEFSVTHLSLFSIFIMQPFSSGFSHLNVYPNPYDQSKLKHTNLGIVFQGLPHNSSIKIYDVSGSIVRIIAAGNSVSAVWDAKNEDGEDVAVGLYIYVVTDSSGDKRSGKIAVKKS